MSRQKKNIVYGFEKRKEDKDLFVRIYAGMMQSKAWGNLTKPAMTLYLYMKLQLFGQNNPIKENKQSFVFNKALYTKTYNLYTNGAQFQRDLKLLVDNGFIEIVEKNWTTRKKNIYQFSDKWQNIK